MDPFSAPVLALVGAWTLNALWPLVAQSGLRLYSPFLFGEAAFVLGFAALLPALFYRREFKAIAAADVWPRFLAIGFFYGVPSFLYIAAMGYTTPSSAGVVAEIEVLYSMLLSAWLLEEAIGLKQIAASLLVVSGTALILGHDLGGGKWKGDVMIAASAWMYQVAHVLVKRLPPHLGSSSIACARILSQSAIFLIPVGLWCWMGPASVRWTWSWPGLTLLIFESVAVIALSGALWYAAIRAMDLAKSTAFLLSYPALTMLLSWSLGREAVSRLQIEGLLATLAGAVWLSLQMAPSRRSA